MDSSAIQRQIELLQSQMIPVKAQALKRVESVEETVKRVLQAEMAKLQPPSLQAEPVANEGVNMLSAIGSALTEEQQQWLSVPENQTCVPEFFSTTEGQAITRRFFAAYKEYKCK